MDNGAPRKLRISADQAFEGWPEEENNFDDNAPDPINVYLDPNELLIKTIGYTMISRAQLADDASYVRFYGKNGIPEAYMNIFSAQDQKFADVTSTGQYFVFKYRMPENVSSLPSFEFFTSTVNSGAVAGDNIVLQKVDQDGEWHVIALDISKRHPTFKADADGKYMAKYFRFDFFNGAVSADMYIDLWLSAIYNDPRVIGSDIGPIVYLRNGTGNPLLNCTQLAKRWGVSRATVSRVLDRFVQLDYIELISFPGNAGSVIFLKDYHKHWFHSYNLLKLY
jgi:hypothetical protein